MNTPQDTQDTQTTKIEHLGKVFETTHYTLPGILTDADCEQIRKDFRALPTYSEVALELYSIHNGATSISKSNKYFFSRLMYDSKLYSQKWSTNEFIQSNDLIRFAHAKVQKFPKVFPLSVIFPIISIQYLGLALVAQQPN
jgi:hypothetical protein